MNVVWFNWKDIRHPDAGGAELIAHELMKRLVAAGHGVTLVTARYRGSEARDNIDGVTIHRVGNRVTHYPRAAVLFVKQLARDADLVIEEVNTVPYFIGLLPRSPRVVLFYPQLAREIWFHQMRLPWSAIGYAIEPLYTWLQGRRAREVVTISKDSKDDLVRFGFRPERIHVINVGIENTPLDHVDPSQKEERFTVLFHSSLRAMKRPIDVVRAFALLVRDAPDCQLWISGGGDQRKLRAFCAANELDGQVAFFGRTSDAVKLDLMRRATVLCSTSVKEGWGLVVTEANSMGTPAIVYDIDGLRSASAAGGNSIVKASPDALAAGLRDAYELFTSARSDYDAWCRRVHATTHRFTLDRCYQDFIGIVSGRFHGEQRRAG